MPEVLTPWELIRRAEQTRDINSVIIQRINRTRRRVEQLEPKVGEYLKGRERVFNNFLVAAEKVAYGLRLSGYVLVYQLKFDVEYLEYLTRLGLGQFSRFLANLVKKDPVVRRNPTVLREMDELQKDIEQFRQSLTSDKEDSLPIDDAYEPICIATCDGTKYY